MTYARITDNKEKLMLFSNHYQKPISVELSGYHIAFDKQINEFTKYRTMIHYTDGYFSIHTVEIYRDIHGNDVVVDDSLYLDGYEYQTPYALDFITAHEYLIDYGFTIDTQKDRDTVKMFSQWLNECQIGETHG